MMLLSQSDHRLGEADEKRYVKLKLKIKATANRWVSNNFVLERKYISYSSVEFNIDNEVWKITLSVKKLSGGIVGVLHIDNNLNVVTHTPCKVISNRIERLESKLAKTIKKQVNIRGSKYGLIQGDGIVGAKYLDDMSIDLLLTDPPYGISNPYACEKQVPRRLRKDGSDFIMPKGNFGEWDYAFDPKTWTSIVLPKIKGWAVIFCSQSQIGEYCNILKDYKFNSIGTFVWQKTNPVPFNHKFKPINAWEAIVVGKRPGTKFNGKVVHNIITCKSPSPQQRIHPTQKPLMVIEKFIQLFSNVGEIVFDPFAGSGTTVIAANRMSRKVISYEKDNSYYAGASNRIIKELENEI